VAKRGVRERVGGMRERRDARPPAGSPSLTRGSFDSSVRPERLTGLLLSPPALRRFGPATADPRRRRSRRRRRDVVAPPSSPLWGLLGVSDPLVDVTSREERETRNAREDSLALPFYLFLFLSLSLFLSFFFSFTVRERFRSLRSSLPLRTVGLKEEDK